MKTLVGDQLAFFNTNQTKDIGWRIEQLKKTPKPFKNERNVIVSSHLCRF